MVAVHDSLQSRVVYFGEWTPTKVRSCNLVKNMQDPPKNSAKNGRSLPFESLKLNHCFFTKATTPQKHKEYRISIYIYIFAVSQVSKPTYWPIEIGLEAHLQRYQSSYWCLASGEGEQCRTPLEKIWTPVERRRWMIVSVCFGGLARGCTLYLFISLEGERERERERERDWKRW